MAKRCDITGKGAQSGNNVSHSHRKTRRRFLPNIQTVSLQSNALSKRISLDVAASTIRSIDHNGGLDNFLLKTSSTKLAPEGVKLKRQIKKALENKPAEAKAAKPAAKPTEPARKTA